VTAYPGYLDDDAFYGTHFGIPGRADAAYTRAPVASQESFATLALEDPVLADDPVSVPHRPAVSPSGYPGHEGIEFTAGRDWFEKMHVVPRAIDFGNILSTIQKTFELYCAYRHQNVSLTSFTNTVDAGTDVIDLPSLPHTIGGQNGIVLTAETKLTSDPNFAGDLIFGFDVGDVPLYIEGVRLVLWYFDPEAPIGETLGFVTDVQRGRGGPEKRPSLRKAPTQRFRCKYRLDGQDRRQARMYLMGWQNKLFGLPIHNEQVQLSAEALIGAFTINTSTNSHSDFRVGGQAVVFTSRDLFDVPVIVSKTASSITFATPMQNDYPVGTRVMPVRQGEIEGIVGGDQHPVNLEDFTVVWDVQDTDVDLADVSAFSSYDGKVLLDNCNPVMRAVKERFNTRVYILDNKTGNRTRTSLWPNMTRGHVQTFVGRTRQAVWEIRQLLYALRGRQVSFYTLTWSDDLLVTGTLTATSALMDIENIGFSRYAEEQNPMRHIRLTFTDGSVLLREILSSVIVDADTERLTVDSAWPSTKLPSEISRVEFVELVRLDSDQIQITHERPDSARSAIPVVSLIDQS
jgi:hypothetical protein